MIEPTGDGYGIGLALIISGILGSIVDLQNILIMILGIVIVAMIELDINRYNKYISKNKTQNK